MQVKDQTLDSRSCSSTLPAQAQDRHRSRHHNHQTTNTMHRIRAAPSLQFQSTQRKVPTLLNKYLPTLPTYVKGATKRPAKWIPPPTSKPTRQHLPSSPQPPTIPKAKLQSTHTRPMFPSSILPPFHPNHQIKCLICLVWPGYLRPLPTIVFRSATRGSPTRTQILAATHTLPKTD